MAIGRHGEPAGHSYQNRIRLREGNAGKTDNDGPMNFPKLMTVDNGRHQVYFFRPAGRSPPGQGKEGIPWNSTWISTNWRIFEVTRIRRKGYPSETRVKRGRRVVHLDKELVEKLGRNDLCPCNSGRRFQELLHAQRSLRRRAT